MRDRETEQLLIEVREAVAAARGRGVTARACIFDAVTAAVDAERRVWPSIEARRVAEALLRVLDEEVPDGR